MDLTVQNKKTAEIQHLYQWASLELKAKGYSPRVIKPAVTKALKHFRGHRLSMINWVKKIPSQRRKSGAWSKQADFVNLRMKPKMILLLQKKGYRLEAATRLAELLIDHAGGAEKCNLASTWSAVREWPAIQ